MINVAGQVQNSPPDVEPHEAVIADLVFAELKPYLVSRATRSCSLCALVRTVDACVRKRTERVIALSMNAAMADSWVFLSANRQSAEGERRPSGGQALRVQGRSPQHCRDLPRQDRQDHLPGRHVGGPLSRVSVPSPALPSRRASLRCIRLVLARSAADTCLHHILLNRDCVPRPLPRRHMDVVPADPATWDRNPFKFVREGDAVYGRGTTDCLGHVALVTCLLAKVCDGAVWRDFLHSLSRCSSLLHTTAVVLKGSFCHSRN